MPHDTAPSFPERPDPDQLTAAVAAAREAVRKTRHIAPHAKTTMANASVARRFATQLREAARATRDRARLLRLEHLQAAGRQIGFEGHWQGYRYKVQLEFARDHAGDPWRWRLSYRERTFYFDATELGGEETGIRAGVEAFLGFLVPPPSSGHI